MRHFRPELEHISADSYLRNRHSDSNTEDFPSRKEAFVEKNLKLGEVIGEGAYGKVRKGTYLEQTVAVKILHAQGEDDSIDGKRLEDEIEREASIIEHKRSPHIVRLLHYIREKKWIITEYCKHGSLYDMIRDESKQEIVFDWKKRIRWMTSVANGMHLLHNEPPDVLHRDLKSSNILIDGHYEAKVGDFGLSRQLRCGYELHRSNSFEQLRMIWQPREVMERGEYSKKSDVFSFGVIMHELILLKGPYGFDTSTSGIDWEIYNLVRSGRGLQVSEDRKELPGEWDPCLEKYIELMYECCHSTANARPDFGEITRRLKAIEKDYNRARSLVEDSVETRGCIVRRLRPILFFAVGAMALYVIVLKAISFAVSEKHDALNIQKRKIGCETISISFSLLILLVVFLSSLFACWKCRRACGDCLCRFRDAIKRRIRKCLYADNSSCANNSMSLPPIPVIWSQPESFPDQPSPFYGYNVAQGTIPPSKDVVNLQIPDAEIWKAIREGFVVELKGDCPCTLESLYQFCVEHSHDQLELSQWEDFIGLLTDEDSPGRETNTYDRYREYLTVPMHPVSQQTNPGGPVGTSCFASGPSNQSAFTQQAEFSFRQNLALLQQSSEECESVRFVPNAQYLEKRVSIGIPVFDLEGQRGSRDLKRATSDNCLQTNHTT